MVVPTYNRGHLVLRCPKSVLGQTYRDFELIVVDDGSNDDTDEVVARLAAFAIIALSAGPEADCGSQASTAATSETTRAPQDPARSV